EVLELPELLGVRGGEVVGLREVLADVVELPLLPVGLDVLVHRFPRYDRNVGGHPPIVVETPIGPQLEVLGGVMPVSSYSVGTRSMTCVNCDRSPPRSLILAGHDTIIGLRVPPKWLATC